MQWNLESKAGQELIREMIGGLTVIVEALDFYARAREPYEPGISRQTTDYATKLNALYNRMVLGE